MAETTGIEWADSTVNTHEGCEKISPACQKCYAAISSPVRTMEMRIGEFLGVEPSADGKRRLKMWGPNGIRYEMLDWAKRLLALNRKARKARLQHEAAVALRHPQAVQLDAYVRPRIFINSLSDTFEDFSGDVYKLVDGNPAVVAHSLDDIRDRLFTLIDVGELDELDLLLLTKRPENILRMVPRHWHGACSRECSGTGGHQTRNHGMAHRFPTNIWIGTTVESQEYADKRIPELLKVPASVRFLSVEPLLGKVDLRQLRIADEPHARGHDCLSGYSTDTPYGYIATGTQDPMSRGRIHQVIVGCESGRNPRPTSDEWVRALRNQCVDNGVAFFYKQQMVDGAIVSLPVLDGKQWAEFPVTP